MDATAFIRAISVLPFFLALCLSFFLIAPSLQAASVTDKTFDIVVIGKTKNDSFYEQAHDGCRAFAQGYQNVRCLYDGPKDFQDIRSQASLIEHYLEEKVDAFLISITNSNYLVSRILKKVKEEGVPVVTFDSDLLVAHHDFRLAYVGTNNFHYGVSLANQAIKRKKSGDNIICLQTGHHNTPNLNERMRGVRYALAGKHVKRLKGENGWFEYERCPFYTLGKRDQAIRQLEHLLAKEEPPTFIAVAGFAQFSSQYIETVRPYQDKIQQKQAIIISADAEDIQLDALRAQLSHVNIGQKPFDMGKLGAKLLYEYLTLDQRPEKSIYYQDFYYCTPENVDECVAK